MTTMAVGYETLFKVDLSKPWSQQPVLGHNRWHPDIPPVTSVKPRTTFHGEVSPWKGKLSF